MTDKVLRYYAVYGATVAAQVRERYKEGRGPPDMTLMRIFVEEAHATAKMAEECQAWHNSEEEDDDLSGI